MAENSHTEAINAVAAPKAVPQFLDPTRAQTLRVWWSFFWPQALASAAVTLAVPRLSAWIIAHGYLTPSLLSFGMPLVRFLLWSTVMIGAMEYALGRSFADFHVALVRPLQGDPQPLPKTFARVAYITWEYAWRVWFYSLVFVLFVALPILLAVGPKPFDSPAASVIFYLLTAGLSYYIFGTHIVNGIFDDAQVEFISNP